MRWSCFALDIRFYFRSRGGTGATHAAGVTEKRCCGCGVVVADGIRGCCGGEAVPEGYGYSKRVLQSTGVDARVREGLIFAESDMCGGRSGKKYKTPADCWDDLWRSVVRAAYNGNWYAWRSCSDLAGCGGMDAENLTLNLGGELWNLQVRVIFLQPSQI